MWCRKPSGFVERRARGERGAAALEFALVAPLFILLLIGIVQFGIMMHSANAVQWAVERGARTALVAGAPSQAALQTVVDEVLAGVAPGARLAIGWTIDASGSIPLARITGTYVHTVDLYVLPAFDARFPVDVTVALAPASPAP